MQIHELNTFSGTLGSSTYLAVDNGTDTAKMSTQFIPDTEEAISDLGVDINGIRKHTKNLFDPSNVLKAYFTTGNITANANTRLVWIPCKPSTTYTVSKTAGTRFTVGYTTSTPAVGVAVSGIDNTHYGQSKITITTGSNAAYLVSWVYNSATDTGITAEAMLASVQIEESSSASSYMPPFSAVDLYAFHSLGFLANNTDLDNVPIDTGFYILQYSNTYTNDPIGASTRRVLSVYSTEENHTSYYLQRITNFENGVAFVRYHTSDGWSDWKTEGYLKLLPSGTDLNNVSGAITGYYVMSAASTYPNDPIGAGARRFFFVYNGNVENTYYMQRIVDAASGREFIRYHTSSGWEDWVSSTASVYNEKAYQLAMRRNASNNEYASLPEVLTLLHFSDLHHHQTNLKDVINIGKQYASIINDIICTGDMVEYWVNGDMSFWTNDADATDIMTVIGNHDAKAEESSAKPNYQRYTMAECRSMYMSNLSSWGVTAPSGATYYYKDYSNSGIRLIVLDATLRDSDASGQLTWLTNTLASAKSSSLSVVIAEHYEPQNPVLIPSDFTNNVHNPVTATWFAFDESYQSAVQSFINGGGKFICYIAGHQHTDYVCYNSNYPDQIFFVVTCAYPDMRFTDQMRATGTPTATCCNMIAFDTTTKSIKVLRFGAKEDYLLRPREYLVYNYQTKAIVRQSSGE